MSQVSRRRAEDQSISLVADRAGSRRQGRVASKDARLTERFKHAQSRRSYAFLKSWFLSGSERMRLPVAEKIALHKAGARGGTAVSPTPPQKPPLATITVSTRGISARRSIG